MQGEDEAMRWRVFGERSLYENPYVHLVKVDIEPPNEERFEHHVARLKRVAVAAVVNGQDEVLMLWRHRFVTDEWGWELPGGLLDPGEDLETTAAREVEEETGWRPGPLRPLLTFQPMIGMVDSEHALFVADSAIRVGDPTDHEEASRVDWIPLESVLGLIEKHQILGAGSLVALLHILASRRAS